MSTPEGLKYKDLRVGGGQSPAKGLLVILDFKAYANDQLFYDTKAEEKPVVLLFGTRPFTAGLCPGVELALSTMRAGGHRIVEVPPALGFGDSGTTLRPTRHSPDKEGIVPPGATLRYDLELLRVSVTPS
jgi:FKBP-type peptidyl-prolyl cis-trans isomerase